jgi:nucleoside-diphosphate-sugar epimerase
MCIYRFIYWIANDIPIQLSGDGSQSRDFTFVEDIARGTIAASQKTGYEIINLGGGQSPTSLLNVIEDIEKLLGKKATITHTPFHCADIRNTQASISKAAKLLNWVPQTSFQEGLEKTVSWYLKNRDFCDSIDLPA